ncbi:gamma-glutamylcyclotransferase family protein [Kushneria indalinina]|uniref:Gamma-glutamyl AIG2-like cyclotransferase n=1 Tax=Kushneria indalinina DSM 14324 TaxID=1122140 RepID=A0A3D9DUN2_9GAMM|nr:gamma-glutamylcyclotransferase family protein [Kushneria indalinina]REC94447.1 gamma-glutamyl AIG2-like cyclotransferase [Kushneria indalinina DSM 14324]
MSKGAPCENDIEVHYYFAYGSNMNVDRMQARVGKTRRMLSATLRNWRLYFDKASRVDGVAHANVRMEEGGLVEGVLYELTHPAQIRDMDPFEGHPCEYCRQVAMVDTADGPLAAWVYVALPGKTGSGRLPAREYLGHLLAGRDFLSHAYLERLSTQHCIDSLEDEALLSLGISRTTPG